MPPFDPLPLQPLLDAAILALPEGLGITIERACAQGEGEPRPKVILNWDDRQKTFLPFAQRIHRVEDLGRLRAKFPPTDAPLLITPYLTETLARRCVALEIPFLDGAGNAFLFGPGLRVLQVGNRPKPGLGAPPPVRPFKPYNRKGLQVLFTLLAAPGLIDGNYRELAKAAGVATGTVGLVMADLLEAGMITRTPTGRTILHFERLVDAWVANYPHKLRPHLQPTRFRAIAHHDWRALDLTGRDAQWGGEVAGDRLTGALQPARATIYTGQPVAAIAAALRLRPDPQGEVEILRRFWYFLNPPAIPPEVVPPLLAYADLVATGDPRNLDIGRIIYERYLHPPGTPR
jgi:hypothetical protein